MVKIYSERKVFSLKTINWAEKSKLSQMKRSGQNILISLSCWQNDSGKFFFPIGQEIWWLLKDYTWSGQLREKSCLGMQRQFFSVDSIIRLSSFFVDSIVRRSLLFFCWFKHPTVNSFFLCVLCRMELLCGHKFNWEREEKKKHPCKCQKLVKMCRIKKVPSTVSEMFSMTSSVGWVLFATMCYI